MPAPSSAIKADGRTVGRSDGPNRCLTPRRSPAPSSPTVAANNTGRRVWTRAAVPDRDEGGQASRIVGNAGTFQARSAPRDRNVELRPEHRVQMRAQHDTVGFRVPLSVPGTYVAHIIYGDVMQPRVNKHFRDAPAARRLRSGRRRDRGQRRLSRERGFIAALDVRARGADAIVYEERVDGRKHHRQLY